MKEQPVKRMRLLALILLLLTTTGCATSHEKTWTTLLDVNVPYDRAWPIVVTAASKHFPDIEINDGQNGLLRSEWKVLDTYRPFLFWGNPAPDKRARVIIRTIEQVPFKAHVIVEQQELNKWLSWVTFLKWTAVRHDERMEKNLTVDIWRAINANVEHSPNNDKRGAGLQLDYSMKSLVDQLTAPLKQQQPPLVAVLPLENFVKPGNTPLGIFLADKITNTLYGTGFVKVVERARLGKLSEELALTAGGDFDEASAKRIGRLLGVDSVVIGSYAELGQQVIEINSRIIHVETGEVLGVGTTHIPRTAVQHLLR